MKTISLLLLLAVSTMQAQTTISVSLHQDARLAFLGDNKGNAAGTTNLLARLKMQGHQQQHGYMVVFPEFEYAEIPGTYKRYSANVGYTLNQLFINNLELSASAGYGWIDRYGKTLFSWSTAGEAAYKISPKLKVTAIAQLTERTDLKWLHDLYTWRFSGFIGLEFNLN